MIHFSPHDVESVLDKSPANVKDNAENERWKSIPLEWTVLILGEEDEKAANVGAEYSDDVDNQPWYEVIRLVFDYSRDSEDVAEQKDGETKAFADSGKYLVPVFVRN